MSLITYFPMGQHPLRAGQLKAAEAALPKLKRSWTLREVPSFEV